MKKTTFVVTGIGTEIGKTFCSAVICEALTASYWKPIQAGSLNNLDSSFVKNHTSHTQIIPERKLLNHAVSPHESARLDGISLNLSDFELPVFKNTTIIEGAGGILVPINDEGLTYLNVFEKWSFPLIVVSKNYLGSINHTLLTVNTLLSKGLTIKTILINGERNLASERIYLAHFPNIPLTFIPQIDTISVESISIIAQQWKEQFTKI